MAGIEFEMVVAWHGGRVVGGFTEHRPYV